MIKGATSKYPLRMTPEERELLELVRTVYGKEGVEMSLNDTLRHLIRRGGIVLRHTPDEALAQIREHCDTCPDCDLQADKPSCPEGLYLARNFKRVREAHQGNVNAHAL
jgi:hypothetical protein